MKPKIKQTVWTLEEYQIGDWLIVQKIVGYLGAEEFVVEGYEYEEPSAWRYDEYKKTWFLSDGAAKAYANKETGKRLKWYRSPVGNYCTSQEDMEMYENGF